MGAELAPREDSAPRGAPEPSGPPGRLIVVSAARFADTAAAFLAQKIRQRAGERRRDDSNAGAQSVPVALSGGSTPPPVYRRLARIPGLPWEAVEVFFGDERCVPPDHPESNYRMARESLLSRVPVAGERIHRMPGDNPDREAAAADYAVLLPPRLGLLHLGLGADGHTASLFPRAPALDVTDRAVVPVRGPASPRQRLTITPPVIRKAAETVVLVTGEEKAEAVRRAIEGPWDPRACPGQLARSGDWILDAAAAGRLEERHP